MLCICWFTLAFEKSPWYVIEPWKRAHLVIIYKKNKATFQCIHVAPANISMCHDTRKVLLQRKWDDRTDGQSHRQTANKLSVCAAMHRRRSKTGKDHIPTNYLPVPVLILIYKLFERVMFKYPFIQLYDNQLSYILI